MTDQNHIDQRIYDLYDEYCHSGMTRRDFLQKAGAITIAGVSGLAMAQSLLPRYAQAQTISFTDERIKATYVDYESPGGSSDSAKFVQSHELSSGMLGSVGFCWGGGATNYLATEMGGDLHAAVLAATPCSKLMSGDPPSSRQKVKTDCLAHPHAPACAKFKVNYFRSISSSAGSPRFSRVSILRSGILSGSG